MAKAYWSMVCHRRLSGCYSFLFCSQWICLQCSTEFVIEAGSSSWTLFLCPLYCGVALRIDVCNSVSGDLLPAAWDVIIIGHRNVTHELGTGMVQWRLKYVVCMTSVIYTGDSKHLLVLGCFHLTGSWNPCSPVWMTCALVTCLAYVEQLTANCILHTIWHGWLHST